MSSREHSPPRAPREAEVGPPTSREELDHRTDLVIAAAIRVHTRLGPGCLEGAYEICLAHELRKHGCQVWTQVAMPICYDDLRIEHAYRLDLLVDGAVAVELKCVKKLLPVHHAQLHSYLRLGGFRVGLLVNFAEERLKHGIKRIVHGF
jgi:GxxExxY protein